MPWFPRRPCKLARRCAALDHRLSRQKVSQVFAHFMRRRVAFRRALRQRPQTNPLQFLGQLLVILQKWTRLVARHLLHEFGPCIAPERLATGEQFVEHDAETEDVAATVNPMPLPTGLFRRHCAPPLAQMSPAVFEPHDGATSYNPACQRRPTLVPPAINGDQRHHHGNSRSTARSSSENFGPGGAEKAKTTRSFSSLRKNPSGGNLRI